MATHFTEVTKSFHATFMEKTEIPDELEQMWLRKAVAEYGVEIAPLSCDFEIGEFIDDVPQYIIDTLAVMMKVMYLERHYSKVNKIASIVGKDLSLNGNNGLQKYAEDELAKTKSELDERLENLKTSAYA